MLIKTPAKAPIAPSIGLLNLAPKNINTKAIKPPTNVSINFTCVTFDDVCINGKIKCLLATNGLGDEISGGSVG